MISQVKSGKLFKGALGDEYILEVLKKEKVSIDRKILVLNCAAASLSILVASWVIFGLIFHRKR